MRSSSSYTYGMSDRFIPLVFQYLSLLLVLSVLGTPAYAAGDNILIIIADDLGVDMLGAYTNRADSPLTPNIDALARNGVKFRNAWSNPLCSPTRATIQTGQYGFRTGVGYVVGISNGLPLNNPSIVPLPKMLDQAQSGYSHAAIGKWHLSSSWSVPNCSASDAKCLKTAPNVAGWSYFSGSWGGALDLPNFPGPANGVTEVGTYFHWQKIASDDPDSPILATTYATTVNVDDSIRWIQKQTNPWLLYLAFNAPHTPYHVPPPNLYCSDALYAAHQCTRDFEDTDPNNSDPNINKIKYKYMIQAMDAEMGRLFDTLGPSVMSKTTVIFLGDNGTPSNIVANSKGTLLEGGINVPLIISGASVKNPNREATALVNMTDLYATVLDLAGVGKTQALNGLKLDSVSVRPILVNSNYKRSLRKYAYSELFNYDVDQSWKRAIRNEQFKLIRTCTDKSQPSSCSQTYYDLISDPGETNNLLQGTLTDVQQRGLDNLAAQLDKLDAGQEKWTVPNGSWNDNAINLILD